MYAKIVNNEVVQYPVPPYKATTDEYVEVSRLEIDHDPFTHQVVYDSQPTKQTDGYWVLQGNLEALEDTTYVNNAARLVRQDRDKKLSETDWVVTKAFETGTEIPEDMKTYRQALRDITNQSGFPYKVVFPDLPN